jgi:hypothetical protein
MRNYYHRDIARWSGRPFGRAARTSGAEPSAIVFAEGGAVLPKSTIKRSFASLRMTWWRNSGRDHQTQKSPKLNASG